MKKFYAFCAAALMSACMYAAAPTVAELAETYNVNDNVVLCVHFTEEAEVCNGVYFVGPISWDENFENHPQFKAVPNHEGWYAAQAPYAEGVQGKPVQAKKDGAFSWDYQSGDPDAWVYVDGKTMNISAGFDGEANISYPEAGAYIYELKYWKNHKTPCVVTPSHDYKIVFYAPACESSEYIPGIIGDFNSWAASEAMNADLDDEGEDCWVFTIHDEEGHAFKFREAGISDWSNQIQVYKAEDDAYDNAPNISLPKATKDTTIVIDYSDPDIYSWTMCGVGPVDSTVYKVTVKVNVPANAPAAGVELVGDFGGDDTWTTGLNMELITETGWYVANLETMGFKVFKIRELGTWDNQIVYADKANEEGKPVALDNMKFQDNWVDGEGEKVKLIELDFSDATKYVWTANWVAPEGIENVVLTEKAQKVVVDGVLYIVRDNKMFNVQGGQVR